MKTLTSLLGLLMIGMAVNAQSIQNNNSIGDLNNNEVVIYEMNSQMDDTQTEDGLVLVLAFDNGSNVSGISLIDGDMTIKSYPNPTTDFLMVEIENYSVIIDDIQFSIYNINGQQIGNWELVEAFSSGNSYQLNIANIPNGTYVLQIRSNNTSLNQTKLIEKL